MSRKMPKQKPGQSKQDYGTPREFLDAVERRYGPIGFDLAATTNNAVVGNFYTEEQNALIQSWQLSPRVRVAWLNPPFANIDPWAERCASVRRLPRWTLLLVPASIGTAWYRDHVLGKAVVDGIPRLTFVGETTPYPKDLMICAFGYGASGNGYWDWRLELGVKAS